MKKLSLLFSMVILSALLVSCASMGSSNLSKGTVEDITEGKTTKDEIVNMLGHPEGMMNFDKKGLEEYLYRITLKRPPEDMFPEDEYEVWTYSKWSYVASPLPFTSHETQQRAIFVINSKNICVKKYFGKEGKFRF